MGRALTELYEKPSNLASLSELIPNRASRIEALRQKKICDLLVVGFNPLGLLLAYQAVFLGLRVAIIGKEDIELGSEISYSYPSSRNFVSYFLASRVFTSQAPKACRYVNNKIFLGIEIKQKELMRALALAASEEGAYVINYLRPLDSISDSFSSKISLLDTRNQKKFGIDVGMIAIAEKIDADRSKIIWSRQHAGTVSIYADNFIDAYSVTRKLLKQIIAKTGLITKIPNLYGKILPNQTSQASIFVRLLQNGVDQQQAEKAINLLGNRAKWIGTEASDYEINQYGLLEGVTRIITETELVTCEDDLLRRIN